MWTLLRPHGRLPGRCAGYCTASPAKKYYQAPYWEVTNPTTWAYRNADWVACTAHPRPGYTFVRWKGEGVAWIANWSNPNDPPPPAYPLDAPDEEVLAVDESGNLMPHVNRPTIYIRTAQKDANGEGGPAHRNLTAIFAPSCAIVDTIARLNAGDMPGAVLAARGSTCVTAIKLERTHFEIEPNNNYSENWTVRATAVDPNSGATLTGFTGRVEIAEDITEDNNGRTIYTQNTTLGASLPGYVDFTVADRGVKDFVAKSLAGPKTPYLARPAPARIVTVNYPLYNMEYCELEQWVDAAQVDMRAIAPVSDWVETKIKDIFENASGDVAHVLLCVEHYEQSTGDFFGQADNLRTALHTIKINPHHDIFRVDLWNCSFTLRCLGLSYNPAINELRKTLLHEGRHAYQRYLVSNGSGAWLCGCNVSITDDGLQDNPENDSDLDWLPE